MKIFYLPDLGEGLPEAEIREWFIHEGDDIQADQPMLSVETAKAIVEVPAPKSGRISKLYGKTGETISTGAPLVEFEEGETQETGTVAGSIEVGQMVLKEAAGGIKPVERSITMPKALPNVRALAKRLNVDLATILPSGPQGQIMAEDVEKAAQTLFKEPEGYEPLPAVRRVMAMSMARSHAEVVPVTLMDDVALDNWSPDMDVTACIIQGILAGLRIEPKLNAWFDGKTLSQRLFSEVNLGLAIDSPAGLFVPVIKHIDTVPVQTIRETINQYKQAVQTRSLTTEALRDATFVLSNFGIFAGRYANPIIVPPTVAILGAGRIREQPSIFKGQIVIRKTLPLSLTIDHRAVTGGEASRFLAAVMESLATAS
jgi:2-oxoisovalerate dehydrogenase E2 component (dihydrolipoyl transacylase)